MIFNVQRFSMHDGEGIRTVIFYKGCPLQCQWCSNPESQSFDHSVLYNQRMCKRFGDCIKADSKAISRLNNRGMNIARDMISDPVKLKHVCASKAITLCGEERSIDELLHEVEKDFPFYKNDGGVTLSGGEPLSQGDNLVGLLKELKKRKINVSMETSLHVAWEKVERCIGLVHTFLVDLKHTDKGLFRNFIRGDAELVLGNLGKFEGTGAHVIVRIPVIPGFNHTKSEMNKIVDFVVTLKSIREIHFLPYHSYGAEKYHMLGMDYLFSTAEPVRESEIEPYVRYAQSLGLETKIGG